MVGEPVMGEPRTVLEIVKLAIQEGGFDGLYNECSDCACLTDDLAPCTQFEEGCRAGYRAPCDGTCDTGDCDFHIVEKMP